jgi:hypothetical protein
MTMTLTKWAEIASNQLLGRRIVGVRYMTIPEMQDFFWQSRALVLELDDGSMIFPAADDEGNDAGVLFTTSKTNPVIPAWRE